jgi:hypothetical protein
MKNFTPDPLRSTDTLTIAKELSNQQIEIIRSDNSLGGEKIAAKLQTLRRAVWGEGKKSHKTSSEQQKQMFDSAVDGLNEKETTQLISSYAKMGNLYEIASLSARANYLENARNNPKDTPPGGVEEFVKNNRTKSTAELTEQLNQPVFEVIMTGHPTNINSKESIAAQRNIALAIENSDNSTLKTAIKEYQKTPISPHDKNGKPKNLTVRDETENMLYALSSIYEDMPKVYSNYDASLSKHAEQTGAKYDPTALQLQTRLGAWGSSGDKDGNANVNAETTLEAIALHTQTALSKYSKDLEKIPALKEFKVDFDKRLEALNPLLEQTGQLRQDARDTADGNKSVPAQELSDRFDALSKQLVEVRSGLDYKKFEQAITKTAKDNENNKDALNLLHRFRTFGFSFGKIEYRETAEEYNRVVEALIPDYKGTPQQRMQNITAILKDENKSPADFVKAHEAEIIANGAGKKYDSIDANPIAYHTLKRMQLARDFGDVIKDNVLAECGKITFPDKRTPTPAETTAQGVANLLEAQFLQRAVEKDGKRATLGIIPLFEEADTMKNVDKIMGAAYNNVAYKDQMKLLQGDATQPTQQVMIAHSDNSRRSGSIAARAYIHEAHKNLRALGDEMGVKTHFYEGGSVTDAYRNGVRALSANINAFKSHDFAKFTFQGGDLLAYFNHPASTERIFDRSIAHQAGHLEKQGTGWKVTPNGTNTNEIIDDVAIAAMKSTYSDYTKNDFQNSKMGVLLKKLDYDGYVDAANISSRAKGRVAFVAGSTAKEGAKHVNIEKARTIGYSMAQQVAALFPTFAGAENLESYINDETKKKYAEIASKDKTKLTKHESDFLKELKTNDGEKLSPKQLHIIYEKSPAFRNAQDLLATAYAFTDLDATDKIIRSNLRRHGNNEKVINSTMENDNYWERIKSTYKKVAELTYKTFTEKPLNTSNYDSSHIVEKMKETLPHAHDTAENKLNYRKFLLDYRQKNPKFYDENELAGDSTKLSTARDLASAFQAVSGGRWLDFSDPTIAKHRMEQQKQMSSR